MVDANSLSAKLCVKGIQAEYEHRLDDASNLYMEAWNAAKDEYDYCIAAHYIAHLEENPESALKWNLEALSHARLVNGNQVKGFYASLFVNVGRSFELLGDSEQAEHYYSLAAEHGLVHDFNYMASFSKHLQTNINNASSVIELERQLEMDK